DSTPAEQDHWQELARQLGLEPATADVQAAEKRPEVDRKHTAEASSSPERKGSSKNEPVSTWAEPVLDSSDEVAEPAESVDEAGGTAIAEDDAPRPADSRRRRRRRSRRSADSAADQGVEPRGEPGLSEGDDDFGGRGRGRQRRRGRGRRKESEVLDAETVDIE